MLSFRTDEFVPAAASMQPRLSENIASFLGTPSDEAKLFVRANANGRGNSRHGA
jgi:hypothetical protein